jgi:outer membrane lipopolysaccharide assembly protein LptE/RlpB
MREYALDLGADDPTPPEADWLVTGKAGCLAPRSHRQSRMLAFCMGLLWGVFLLIHSASGGCGYHPATLSPSAIETSVYRMMIPVFFNDTFEPVLEGKVTRRVKQEFITHGGFQIVQNPAQAHLILEGRITSFGLTPLSFNQEYRVAEYRVNIGTNVKVLKAQDKKLLWQNGVEATAEFVVSPDPGVSRSVQDLATDEAAKRVAEEIWISVSRLRLSEANQKEGP